MSTALAMSTAPADNQPFADMLLRLQVHAALAQEKVQQSKSPISYLAKSCALLDNCYLDGSVPLTAVKPTAAGTLQQPPLPQQQHQPLTDSQKSIIQSLRIEAYEALTNAYLAQNPIPDLVQAEAALPILLKLQQEKANISTFSRKTKNSASNTKKQAQAIGDISESSTEVGSLTMLPVSASTSPLSLRSPSPDGKPTAKDYAELVTTLQKIKYVAESLGKNQIATNTEKLIQKYKSLALELTQQ